MPCIRLQLPLGSLNHLDPLELLGRSSQCLADVMGGGHQYIMALWEPVLGEGERLMVDILAIGDEEIPDHAICRSKMETLFASILTGDCAGFGLTVRQSERSEWDAWEEGAVDGFRVVYGLYEPGRTWAPPPEL